MPKLLFLLLIFAFYFSRIKTICNLVSGLNSNTLNKYTVKQISVLLLVINSLFSYSQTKMIKVTYGITILEEENLFNNNGNLRKLFTDAMANAKKHSFTLLIQDNNTRFCHDNLLTSDETRGTNSVLFVNYTGQTFTKKDTVFTNCPSLDSNIYIIRKVISNWQITAETKLIDNYKCYKATNIFQVTSPNKVFNHPVTAWFCPDLPYSFGPNGYGGLPGLILELQVRNAVYGVRKIDFNAKENFSLKELNGIKRMSQDEVNDLLEKKVREDFLQDGK